MKRRVIALIAAAGQGTRLGAAVPKAFVPLRGRSLLERSVTAMETSQIVDEIVVVVSPEMEELAQAALQGKRVHLITVNNYLAQRDAQWEHLVDTLAAAPAQPDAVTTAAGAVAAATVLRRLTGVSDPPGVSAKAPARGEMLIADPFGPVPLVRSAHGPHPRCPVCY